MSRLFKASEIGVESREVRIDSTPQERAALAARFDLLSLAALDATVFVRREEAGIRLTGLVRGTAEQSCVLSGEAVPAIIDAPLDLLFAEDTQPETADAEIELDSGACDVMPFDGLAVDAGEAVAQTLGLALDPFPRATGAEIDAAREHLLSEDEALAARSPFAALKKG